MRDFGLSNTTIRRDATSAIVRKPVLAAIVITACAILAWQLVVNAQGRMLLEKAVPAWSEAQQRVKKVLGDGFAEQLNQAMKRVNGQAAVS